MQSNFQVANIKGKDIDTNTNLVHWESEREWGAEEEEE